MSKFSISERGQLKEVCKETDHLLITSPNSFEEGINIMKNLV